MWVESNDRVLELIQHGCLNSLNVDKHLYQWAYCPWLHMVMYICGYLENQMLKKIDYLKDYSRTSKLNESVIVKKDEPLTEEVKLRIYSSSDKYIPFIQMVDNPGEMFDLNKFGKTQGFIKASTELFNNKMMICLLI